MKTALFFVVVLQVANCSCPPGFDLVRNGQCRGRNGLVNVTFANSTETVIAKCKEINALPAIIHDDEQNSYWSNLQDVCFDRFPLALACNSSSKQWLWPDGSYVDYKPATGYDPELDDDCKSDCDWWFFHGGFWGIRCNDPVTTHLSDIMCTTQLHLQVPSKDGCEGFDDDSEDGVCYQIGSKAENWQEAQTICRSVGANVASIHNTQENSFVRRLAVSKGEVKGVFIGATKSGKSDDYSWTDGSEWNYDNFYPGFPMDGYGDCVIMDTEGTSGLWANVDCSSQWSVSCIRQQNFTPPACSPGPWREEELIFSPGFPFDASTPCDFIFEVDAGKRVEVEVLLLEANSCCDHLILFEDYVGGTVVANLTGEISDKTYTTSSSNFMRVSWQPNGGVNVRGMMMTFRAA